MSVEPTHLRPTARRHDPRWRTADVIVAIGLVWLAAVGIYGILIQLG